MYGSQGYSAMPDCHAFCLLLSGFSNVYHFACVWPTALKLGCVTNLDTLFLVMGFISLVDEIQFMLISSRHIYIRSILSITGCALYSGLNEAQFIYFVYARFENDLVL